MFSSDQLQGLLRHLLTIGAGALGVEAYATGDAIAAIASGLAAAVGVAWSYFAKKKNEPTA